MPYFFLTQHLWLQSFLLVPPPALNVAKGSGKDRCGQEKRRKRRRGTLKSQCHDPPKFEVQRFCSWWETLPLRDKHGKVGILGKRKCYEAKI